MKDILPLSPHYKPVSAANLYLRLYYSGLGNQHYSGLAHKNGLVLFETDRNLFLFYRRIYNAVKTTQASLKPYIIARNAVVRPGPSGLGKRFSLMEVLSLHEALSEIDRYRSAVEEENARRGLVQTNRKPVFFFVEIDGDWAKELESSVDLRQKLKDMMANSESSRVYLWVMARSANLLQDGLLRSFDFSVFLGEANSHKARSLFSDLVEQPYDDRRKIVGILRDKRYNDLRPIHHISTEKSELKELNDKIDEIEEVAYRQLLESLS